MEGQAQMRGLLAILVICATTCLIALGARALTTYTTPPVQAPTVAPEESGALGMCPYCHRVHEGRFVDGVFRFKDHPFVELPLTDTTSLRTCQDAFGAGMHKLVEAMVGADMGEIIDADNAPAVSSSKPRVVI